MMARRAPNLAKRDLRNLQTTRASLVGSAFASTHFDRSPMVGSWASFEYVESFFAVHTPPNHLIRTDFEQEGVIPEFCEILQTMGYYQHEEQSDSKSSMRGNVSVDCPCSEFILDEGSSSLER
ncbi:hypothetical protein Tco_0764693 [Tanacetum coccineum]